MSLPQLAALTMVEIVGDYGGGWAYLVTFTDAKV
jgi:hypothetical protein